VPNMLMRLLLLRTIYFSYKLGPKGKLLCVLKRQQYDVHKVFFKIILFLSQDLFKVAFSAFSFQAFFIL
jgi:hypothetical protein